MLADEIKKELNEKLSRILPLDARLLELYRRAMKTKHRFDCIVKKTDYCEKCNEVIELMHELDGEVGGELVPFVPYIKFHILDLNSDARALYILNKAIKLEASTNPSPLSEDPFDKWLFNLNADNPPASSKGFGFEVDCLDSKILDLRLGMEERLRKIKPLILNEKVPYKISKLYERMVQTYLCGLFEATFVLCRMIVEIMAKRRIKDAGYSNLLSGKERSNKSMSIEGLLKEKLKYDVQLIQLYRKIVNKADRVLHDEDEVADGQAALKSIEYLQRFMVEAPKTL